MDIDTDGFTDLLTHAEQLTAQMDAGAELPRVKRNLPQILEAGQRLWARNAQLGQDSADVKASILLGAKGYDVPKISQTLEGLSTMKTFEPLEPLHDTDIQGFLKNERENALLAVIEQSRKKTMEAIQSRQWENLESEWEQDKQKILSALIGTNQEFLPFSQDTTLLDDTVNMQGRSSLDNFEMAYSRQVYMHNEEVIRGGILTSLVDRFVGVAKELSDKNMVELWNQMRYMTEIPMSKQPVPTRQSDDANGHFISQALSYLEYSFKQYMTTTIYENLHRAQLGGVPGTVQLVRSYLNVKQLNSLSLEDGAVEGQPVWAMIYYCLRCGDLKAATDVVGKVQHKVGDFASFLQDYASSCGRRLSPANETKIRLQYRRIIRNSRDPYKRAVYCVVGRCDGNDDHGEVADKIDDYLWVKLNHTSRAKTSEPAQDLSTLAQLQHLLYVDFGESHFAAYQQPYLYVQVLVLTAQFEAAIDFLSRVDKLRCHAVHMALALHELKLLNMSTSVQSQLLTKDSRADGSFLYRINLSRLLMLYTRKFEVTDSRDALQYFYFLREVETAQGDNLFMSCVSELAQETREFDMLLGRLERDGTRRPGAIDKFHSDTQKIIEVVASDTEAKGLFEDAVKLYDLAKKPDKVLELLNKLLGQVVSHSGVNQSARDRLRALGVGIAERYKSLTISYNQSTSSTFYLLLDLLTFFDLYHAASYDKALEVIEQLKLLPLTTDVVEHKVNDFKHYTDEIRRCLPDILIATMNSLLSLYKNTRASSATQSPSMVSSGTSDGGRDTFYNYLRSQAKALIMFAGMLPYRMPGDTNARLVQMEVLMN